ncbi:MAG: PKD domain-containing protein [Bacteroidia bacterium]
MRLIPINIPSGLTERSTIVSGAITPQDESSGFKDCGVIFTTSVSPSPEDFDPQLLLHAIVENTELPPEDTDRYFTVIGGYYFERIRVNNQKEAKTTHVFGVALDRSQGFFMEEGGSVILRDHWRLLEDKRSLDATNERTAGEKTGWTLIVAEAKLPRSKYPMSGKPMQIFVECSDVTGLKIAREDLSEGSLTIDFLAITNGSGLTSFLWNMGDGSSEQSTHTPEFTYTFPRLPGEEKTYEISVKGEGAAGCESSSKTRLTVPSVPDEPVCPSIRGIRQTPGELTSSQMTVNFTADIDGESPSEYIWDFGDGSKAEKTAEPEITHIFERPDGDAMTYEVRLVINGTGKCTDEATVFCQIPGECPILTGISQSEGDSNENGYSVAFTVLFTGPAPEKFIWDFGDGTEEKISELPSISHSFSQPEGEGIQLPVKVGTSGPGSCSGLAETNVFVPGKEIKFECPIFQEITFEADQVETQALAYTFTVHYKGPKPGQFIWELGGKTEPFVTQEPIFTNIYKQPGGKPEKRTIRVLMEGPSNCSDGGELTFILPGVCPVISEMSYDLLAPSPRKQEVQFRAWIDGPAADSYEWDFGDGTPVLTTDSAMPVHVYDRPAGKSSSYKVRVAANGPGECFSEARIDCEIPGVCPHFTELQQVVKEQSLETYEVTFTAVHEWPSPESYVWDFGDGSEKVSVQVNSITHTFQRPAGKPVLLQVEVVGMGPGECYTVLRDYCEIPGTCPVIDAVTLAPSALEEKTQTVTFTAITHGPQPEKFTWDVNDGSERIVTENNVLTHTFSRPAGKDKEFQIKLTINGPASCIDGKTVVHSVKGRCPEILNLSVENESLETSKLNCLFSAQLNDLSAESYVWNFGDGSPEQTTRQPQIRHTFARPVGRAVRYKITVAGVGPDPCKTQASVNVDVPFVCPEIARIAFTARTPVASGMEVAFEAQLSLPEPLPNAFVWDFGDGSKAVTTTIPKITHIFPRPSGDAANFQVVLTTSGPDQCSARGEVSVAVPGICPVISDVQVSTELKNDALVVTLKPVVSGPAPEGYKVEWGDGLFRPEMLVQPPFVNTYPRPVGEDQPVKIRVMSFGPGTCQSAREIDIVVAAQCPVITNVRQTVTAQDLLTFTLRLEAVYEGPKPGQFIWDWMNGSEPEVTTSPVNTHTFDRLAGTDQSLTVKISTQGPKNCSYTEVVPLHIPGSCPKVTNIQKEILEVGPDAQTWRLKVIYAGYNPESFVWNWGDGSKPEISVLAEAEHTFQRKPGDDKTYIVSATAKGPGRCENSGETTVEIPGICPKLRKVNLTYGAPTKTGQPISAQVAVDGPLPEVFYWNWGDGSVVEETTKPLASHTYERKPGDDKIYSVIVTAKGPEGCQSGASADADIPGICPAILKINAIYAAPEPEYQEIKFVAILDGPAPGQIVWEWGDGSALTRTAGTEAVHRYRRLPGDAVGYTVQVMPEGPESCRCEDSLGVSIPGICPELKEVKATLSRPEGAVQQVRARVIFAGPKPEKYFWNWGDGTAIEETTSAENVHEFLRPDGDDVSRKIVVNTQGPGSCDQSIETNVSIEGICPAIQKVNQQQLALEKAVQKMKFMLVVDGPKPVSYSWNWGDGSKPVTTIVPEAEHTYTRPMGDDVFFDIQVVATGPGKKCVIPAQSRVKVTGVCPMVEEMKVESVASAREYEDIRVTLKIDGPAPEKIRFDWGDRETPTIQKELIATHRYLRLPGEDKKYFITARLNGPGKCENDDEVSVNIAGICPLITAVSAETQSAGILKKSVICHVITDGPQPAFYEWNWGDGSKNEKTDKPFAEHEYTRLFGEDADFAVSVTCFGPGKCKVSGQTLVKVEGVCPSVVSVSAEALPPHGPDQSVWFTANLAEGPLPESYQWNWGDGTSDETAIVRVKHTYKRPFGENKTFAVSLTCTGPKSCQTSSATNVEIQGWCSENIQLNTVRKALRPVSQEMEFVVTTDGPPPAGYFWDFGDGKPVQETRIPVVLYSYQRLPGDDRNYQVSVTAMGPGPCSISAEQLVRVEGICPHIKSIDHQLLPSSDEKQSIRVWVEVEGPQEGVEYIWEWGDKTQSVTSIPEAVHAWNRLYGKDQQILVSVSLKGPESCGCNAITQVYIPGRCPKLVYAGTDFGEYDHEYQDVTVTFDIEGEGPESYSWYWGDGQTFGTDGLIGQHRYKRPLEDTDYSVRIVANGPGYCAAEQCVVIQIEGSCPRITRLQTSYCGDSAEGQEVRIFAQTRREGRFHYEWNWGDGSRIEKTTEPVAKHFYRFGEGKPRDYQVSVTVTGKVHHHEEEGCEDIFCGNTETTTVHIAGFCPAIVSVRPVLGKSDRSSQWIKLIAITRGGQPSRYTWDWGDTSARETTSAPHAAHLFRKDHDGPRTYSVRVIAWGPASKKGGKECQAQYEVQIKLEGEQVFIDC